MAEISTTAIAGEAAAAPRAVEFDVTSDGLPRDRIDNGSSLRERIDAVQEPSEPEDDSIDAIRKEAARALEEARSLRDAQPGEPFVGIDTEVPETFTPPLVIDYSPSVQPAARADEEDEDDVSDDETPLESRYSRKSAKLPHLGIEPESASSTIADLRRQMTADS